MNNFSTNFEASYTQQTLSHLPVTAETRKACALYTIKARGSDYVLLRPSWLEHTLDSSDGTLLQQIVASHSISTCYNKISSGNNCNNLSQ